jgi:hypothetical protein
MCVSLNTTDSAPCVYLLCFDTPQNVGAPTLHMAKFRLHRGVVYGQNAIRFYGTRATASSFTPIRKVWPFLARLAQTAQTAQTLSTATCKPTERHKTRSSNLAVRKEIQLAFWYSVADTVPTGMKHTNVRGVRWRCSALYVAQNGR